MREQQEAAGRHRDGARAFFGLECLHQQFRDRGERQRRSTEGEACDKQWGGDSSEDERTKHGIQGDHDRNHENDDDPVILALDTHCEKVTAAC